MEYVSCFPWVEIWHFIQIDNLHGVSDLVFGEGCKECCRFVVCGFDQECDNG